MQNLRNVIYNKPYSHFDVFSNKCTRGKKLRLKSDTITYLFSFNGQERDDEVAGVGNIMTATFWEYDARLGRRWNLDPKPHIGLSDYSCLGNNPIVNIDPNGDYFFGLIGSTTEQRAAAKSFAKQNGGTIENYHSKNICVKYSSVVGLYDAEVGKDVATVIANTAHFHIDGSVSKKEVKSSYSFEFSLDVNLSVGPQIGIEAEAFGRTAGYEVNVASIDLLSLKSEIQNMEGNATFNHIGKDGKGTIKQGLSGGIGIASAGIEREFEGDLTGTGAVNDDRIKVKAGIGVGPVGGSYEAEIPLGDGGKRKPSSNSVSTEAGGLFKFILGVEAKMKIGVKERGQ
jgi:RHS repeat-associated protein